MSDTPMKKISDQITALKKAHGEVLEMKICQSEGWYYFLFQDNHEETIELLEGEDYEGPLTL